MQIAMVNHGRTLRTFVCLLCLECWLFAAVLIMPTNSDTNSNVTAEIPIGKQVTFMMGVTVDNDSNLTLNNIKMSDNLSAEFEFS